MSITAMEALFDLPTQDLKKLSFCKTDKDSIQLWVDQLPVADMAASTRLLYAAIQEVCRLKVPAAMRMAIIDILRPAIHFACEGLKKSYLNQPIILPEQPRKIANLSQALRKYLAMASLSVVQQCQQKMSAVLLKPSALLAKASYYSLYEFEQILICNYLLYRPVEEGFWLKVHSLYQLCASHKLHNKAVKLNKDNKGENVETLYHQLMLWGCIKANQLRQDDIKSLRDLLPQWATLIHLQPANSNDKNALLIDAQTDMPPIYQKFHQGKFSDACRHINSNDLIAELKPLADPLLPGTTTLSPNLISHLILAWSVFTDRTFMRLDTNTELAVCIGLTNTHFFLAQQKPFEKLVYGAAGAPDQIQVKTAGRQPVSAQIGNSNFQKQAKKKLDVWDESLYGNKTTDKTTVTMESINFHMRSGGSSRMTTSGTNQEKYQNFNVQVVNMSPGGYCIEWLDSTPNSIKAGEIIGVRGEHHNSWHIGSIRWVKQSDKRGLQIGVELISPSAQPYGAKLVAMSGKDKTDYLRALLLPEMQAAGQSPSIITPSLSFKVGQHIHLMLDGEEQTILLRELKTSTGSYSQFTYEPIKPLATEVSSGSIKAFEKSSTSPPANDIDSVWELL